MSPLPKMPTPKMITELNPEDLIDVVFDFITSLNRYMLLILEVAWPMAKAKGWKRSSKSRAPSSADNFISRVFSG
jgi:hypothetical protein